MADQNLTYLFEETCTPKIHTELIKIEMQDRSVIFGGCGKHDHVNIGRNSLFCVPKQPFPDPAISILRFNVQLINFKILGSRFINRGVFLGRCDMTEQISANQIFVRCNKDPFLFEIIRTVSAITITGVVLFPFLRKCNQLNCDTFRKFDFFYRHIFSSLHYRFSFRNFRISSRKAK